MSRNPVQQHTGSKSNQITKMSAYWKFGKKFWEQENYSQLSFFSFLVLCLEHHCPKSPWRQPHATPLMHT